MPSNVFGQENGTERKLPAQSGPLLFSNNLCTFGAVVKEKAISKESGFSFFLKKKYILALDVIGWARNMVFQEIS